MSTGDAGMSARRVKQRRINGHLVDDRLASSCVVADDRRRARRRACLARDSDTCALLNCVNAKANLAVLKMRV